MIIGIDPGLKGALAFLSKNRVIVKPIPTLKIGKTKEAIDEYAVCKILEQRKKKIEMVYIEKVHSMPGQGVSSTFTFGAGWGLLRGICVGLKIPYTLVHPTTWKKAICRDVPKGKDVSIIIVKRLFPQVDLKRTKRSRKDDNNLADALCIAEYGRRTLGSE